MAQIADHSRPPIPSDNTSTFWTHFSEYYMVRTEAVIDDGRHAPTPYYRNIIDCVHYSIRPVAYRSDIDYVSIQEYDSSGE